MASSAGSGPMADRLVEILRGIAEDPAPWFWETADAHGAKVAAEVRALARAEVAGDQLDAERRGHTEPEHWCDPTFGGPGGFVPGPKEKCRRCVVPPTAEELTCSTHRDFMCPYPKCESERPRKWL
jgi:hypothetical protein